MFTSALRLQPPFEHELHTQMVGPGCGHAWSYEYVIIYYIYMHIHWAGTVGLNVVISSSCMFGCVWCVKKHKENITHTGFPEPNPWSVFAPVRSVGLFLKATPTRCAERVSPPIRAADPVPLGGPSRHPSWTASARSLLRGSRAFGRSRHTAGVSTHVDLVFSLTS